MSPPSMSSMVKSQMDSSTNPLSEEGDEDVNTSNPTSQTKRKETDAADDSKSKKKPRSFVWDHFNRLKDNYNQCTCNYCLKKLACPSSAGTSNLLKHLDSCNKYKVWLSEHKQMVFSDDASLRVGKVSDRELRDATNEMIVVAELPFAFVECAAWRNFCSKIRLPRPHSRRTATKDIVELFAKKKAAMRKLIGGNKQRFSLTTDIWVAPHTKASYMVITAHYIDENWKMRKLIIGFKNVNDHKGVTISSVLLGCLAEWDITRLFSITVDNATANGTAIHKFKEQFNVVGNDAFVLYGDFLHIRCATHILNLVVKDGLQEIDGSVCAVRNGIQYVRSSGNREKAFALRVDTGNFCRGSLPPDVSTRWNSTYLMLNQALKFRVAFDKLVQEDIPYCSYFLETVDGVKRVGPPSSSDWESIDALLKVLVLFYNSTLVLSASTTICSHKCYNEIVTIARNLQRYNMGPNSSLRSRSNAMIKKLDKYWSSSEINKLIIVASVFDPTKKMKFAQLCFEKLYGKDSSEANLLNSSVMDILIRLFDEYSGYVTSSQSHATSCQSHATSSQSQDQVIVTEIDVGNELGYERMDALYKELVSDMGFQDCSTELEIYLKENVENPNVMIGSQFDVLSWWKANSLKFPVLSAIAKDILAMQISSVASESAFSTSGRILEPSRSCLTHDMIEVLMCVQQWLKCDIHSSDKLNVTIQEMLSDFQLQDDLIKEFGGAQDVCE